MTSSSALPPRFSLSITTGIDANARPLRMARQG